MYDPERRWSLSFAGCGFLGFYHVGATLCLSERAPHLLRDAHTFFGCSAGALHAVTFVCSLPLGASTSTTQASRAGRGCSTWEIGNTIGVTGETCPESSHPSQCRWAPSWRPGACHLAWDFPERAGAEAFCTGDSRASSFRRALALWFEMGPQLGSCQLGHS